MQEVMPAMQEVMASHVAELKGALTVAPQTNEVGRSAGLNLLVDRFRFEMQGWSCGPDDSPLVLRDGIQGPVSPQRFSVVSRRGCDLEPVDAATPEGQLRLTSFVWPFHLDRHERLKAAVESSRARMAVAHVAMEYPKDRPGGADQAELCVDGDVVGLVAHHGGTVQVGAGP